jgi:hypothetical protein
MIYFWKLLKSTLIVARRVDVEILQRVFGSLSPAVASESQSIIKTAAKEKSCHTSLHNYLVLSSGLL